MKNFIKNILGWQYYFYGLILLSAILDVFVGIPSFLLVMVGWICSGVFGLIILVRFYLKREISTNLIIAALPGLVTSSWLLLLSLLGTINKVSYCDFGPEQLPNYILLVAVCQLPLWFTKEKRFVLKHSAVQFILFVLINWQYTN